MDDIAPRVLKFLSKQLKEKPAKLDMDTSLDILGIDSLGMVEIIFGLEDEFNITIPESNDIKERLKAFATVADIIKMVESLSESPVQLR
jgi:acyl carrier protein